MTKIFVEELSYTGSVIKLQLKDKKGKSKKKQAQTTKHIDRHWQTGTDRDWHGKTGAPTEPGKMTLQRGGINRMDLCLHTATWPGLGPCLAQTVWVQSRERFLLLFGNGSDRSMEWGLLVRDSPAREQREIPGLVWEWLAGTGPH